MRRALTLAQQHFALRHCRAVRGQGNVDRQRLIWNFDAQPTPLSRRYRIRLTYARGGTPVIVVLEPDLLELSDGRRPPHIYSVGPPVKLCLYLPGREWSSKQFLATTIVPWVYLWLFFFEHWLLTGEWCGGGEHPAGDDEPSQREIAHSTEES